MSQLCSDYFIRVECASTSHAPRMQTLAKRQLTRGGLGNQRILHFYVGSVCLVMLTSTVWALPMEKWREGHGRRSHTARTQGLCKMLQTHLASPSPLGVAAP